MVDWSVTPSFIVYWRIYIPRSRKFYYAISETYISVDGAFSCLENDNDYDKYNDDNDDNNGDDYDNSHIGNENNNNESAHSTLICVSQCQDSSYARSVALTIHYFRHFTHIS